MMVVIMLILMVALMFMMTRGPSLMGSRSLWMNNNAQKSNGIRFSFQIEGDRLNQISGKNQC